MKKLIVLMMVLMMVFVLIGCSGITVSRAERTLILGRLLATGFSVRIRISPTSRCTALVLGWLKKPSPKGPTDTGDAETRRKKQVIGNMYF